MAEAAQDIEEVILDCVGPICLSRRQKGRTISEEKLSFDALLRKAKNALRSYRYDRFTWLDDP